jgi:hypothetical protein
MDSSQATLPNQLLSNARRLIVLVTDLDVDDIVLGRRIWDIARSAHTDVTYLCVVRHWGDELKAIHKLTQLLSVTNDPTFRTETLIKAETSWLKAIREIRRPGDLIICGQSQRRSSHLPWRTPFYRSLFDRLQIPVITIPLF